MGKRNKTVALVGAAVGFTLFLGVGLLPSVMYGGYAGLLLATGVFGAPVEPTFAARGLILFGMFLAVFGTAAFFSVAGAAAASLVGHALAGEPEAPAEPAKSLNHHV